jgi:hypothetical protein
VTDLSGVSVDSLVYLNWTVPKDNDYEITKYIINYEYEM